MTQADTTRTALTPRPTAEARPTRWPHRPAGLAYGGDYNPEQWPEPTWAEDAALMRRAGVNLVSVGIFSWALLERGPGKYEFDWLDRVLDLLHGAEICVDLATPTAAPPAWLLARHPRIRPVTREGLVLSGGARATYCPSSPEYREAAAAIAEQMGRRYGDHPALVLWHVHNEYGAPTGACYCDRCAVEFRAWLGDRYGSLDGLNHAWGTAFWGQTYWDWDEIQPPRIAPTTVNPAQRLDFARFSSDSILRLFRAERDILHRLSPGVPVTTNFMASSCRSLDYWTWAAEVDVVSNDHYLRAEAPDNHIDLALAADLTRSLAGGAPWLLMEHSTSAVNWQPRNVAKRPGQMRRNSLAHVARGADSVLFFQWRASRSGVEKFHSAMLPHGGTETRIWREVVALGTELAALRALRGTRVAADVAVVWDWQSWWALEQEGGRPSVDVTYRTPMEAYYERLWRDQLTVDFVPPTAELSGYPLVVVPSLYLTTVEAAANLTGYVRSGGTLVVSYFSGIVDVDDAVHPGGYPGALREVLGLTVEEFLPLPAGVEVGLSDGSTASLWSEALVLDGAEAVLTYLDGPAAGGPAVTRHRLGSGQAWYASTGPRDLGAVLRGAYVDAGLTPRTGGPDGVEMVRRVGPAGEEYVVVLNHTDADAEVALTGRDLVTGAPCGPTLLVAAGDVRVVACREGDAS